MHPSRRAALDHQHTLAAEGKWDELYRRTMLWEFPDEALLGFQLAFYRPFAVPRMAEILVQSGQFSTGAEKRSYDTGLIIHEIIYGGLDSPVAKQMVGLMNRLHRSWSIEQEDFTYILNAFIVVPFRHIDRAGWRRPVEVEKEAAWRFYHRLGRMMGIQVLPDSYAAAIEQFDDYERGHVAASAAGHRLNREVLAVLRQRLPAPLRLCAGPLNSILLDDPQVASALGLPQVGPAIGFAAHQAMRAKASFTKARPAPTKSAFTPGQPAGRIYPHGYSVEQLGRHR